MSTHKWYTHVLQEAPPPSRKTHEARPPNLFRLTPWKTNQGTSHDLLPSMHVACARPNGMSPMQGPSMVCKPKQHQCCSMQLTAEALFKPAGATAAAQAATAAPWQWQRQLLLVFTHMLRLQPLRLCLLCAVFALSSNGCMKSCRADYHISVCCSPLPLLSVAFLSIALSGITLLAKPNRWQDVHALQASLFHLPGRR